MIIFPIGVGPRLPRFSYLSVLLIAFTVFVSVRHFDTVNRHYIAQTELFQKMIADESAAAVQQICELEHAGNREKCSSLKADLNRLLARSLASLHKKTKSSEAGETSAAAATAAAAADKTTDEKAASKESTSEKALKEKPKTRNLSRRWRQNKLLLQYWGMFTRPQLLAEHKLLGGTESGLALSAKLQVFQKADDLLSKKFDAFTLGNFNFKTLFYYLFGHADWMHLIGNMVALMALGLFVEPRVSTLQFLGIYFIGGLFAGSVFLFFFSHGSSLIGASGAISALAGASIAFFWNMNVRVWFSMVIYHRVVSIPYYYVFPFVFLAGDIAGLLSGNFSPVAFQAHLSGLCFGLAAGWLIKKSQNLPEGFAFPKEHRLWQNLQTVPPNEQTDGLLTIVRWNPNNHAAVKQLVLLQFSLEQANQQQQKISEATLEGASMLMRKYLDEERFRSALSMLNATPVNLSLKRMYPDIPVRHLVRLIQDALKNNELKTTLRLLGYFFETYPESRIIQSCVDVANQTVGAAIDHACNNESFFHEFKDFVHDLQKQTSQPQFRQCLDATAASLNQIYTERYQRESA